MTETLPIISIITATYNRSSVLRYAVLSVVKQTYSSWELLVIGDHCTDDTEEVVNSFNDARIRFINRERNFGEQSAPNNDGIKLAKGKYIAFLNHDDLWLPDHLKISLRHIEQQEADIVYTVAVRIESNNVVDLINNSLTKNYDPTVMPPATTWLVRRTLFDELGMWRSYKQLYNIPSQDFLFRAFNANKKIILAPFITAVIFHSGTRKNSYILNNVTEQDFYSNKISSPDVFRLEILERIITTYQSNFSRTLSPVKLFSRAMKNCLLQTLMFFGIHPTAFLNFVKNPVKGGTIKSLRKFRGLKSK